MGDGWCWAMLPMPPQQGMGSPGGPALSRTMHWPAGSKFVILH